MKYMRDRLASDLRRYRKMGQKEQAAYMLRAFKSCFGGMLRKGE